MSYLTLRKGIPNFSKAVISIWFRIPQETADNTEAPFSGADFAVFAGVIPILVLGPQAYGSVTNFTDEIVGYLYDPSDPRYQPVHSTLPTSPRDAPMAPTFIGVDKNGLLCIHIQTGSVGSSAQISFNMIEHTDTWIDPPGYWYSTTVYDDHTGNVFKYPDSFGNAGLPKELGVVGESDAGFPEVSFDQWHHLLLSWDLGEGNASHGIYWGDRPDSPPTRENKHEYVNSSSTLYCALDDVDRKGENGDGTPQLPGMRYPGMAPNATVSYNTYEVAGLDNLYGPDSSTITTDLSGTPSGPPTYSVGFTDTSMNGVFIPAELEYQISFPHREDAGADIEQVKPIRRVEMAELQIFTGVTLDTGVESNRRAFIDYERDKNGNIIRDNAGKGTLKPVNPKAAADLLGKKPDVLLHGSSNWINGKNTGITGIDDSVEPPKEKPEGQFQRTGGIKAYKPEPSLVA